MGIAVVELKGGKACERPQRAGLGLDRHLDPSLLFVANTIAQAWRAWRRLSNASILHMCRIKSIGNVFL